MVFLWVVRHPTAIVWQGQGLPCSRNMRLDRKTRYAVLTIIRAWPQRQIPEVGQGKPCPYGSMALT